MISIDFSIAISCFFIIIINILLISWIRGKRHKDKDLALDTKFVWFCAICAYTYINTKDENISICPRCGSYNKK